MREFGLQRRRAVGGKYQRKRGKNECNRDYARYNFQLCKLLCRGGRGKARESE